MQEVSQKRSAQGCIGTLGVKSILLTRLPPMVHADLRLQKSYKFSGSKRTLKRGSEPEPKAEGTLEVKATSDKTTSVVQGIKEEGVNQRPRLQALWESKCGFRLCEGPPVTRSVR
ncbi:uncharacterized protein LOC135351093 isoform X1 [Halichondria panicea]|uniref:uncharacterized protein LOC135351093 isoform X1 n=1 Tax=Halichondria panicea TaxID=6063 RepID=UPI00312B86D8